MAEEETPTVGTKEERAELGAAYASALAALKDIDSALAKVRGMSNRLLASLAVRNDAAAALTTIEREATDRAELLPELGDLAEQIRFHLVETEGLSTVMVELAATLYGAALQLEELRTIWIEKADTLLELIHVAASPAESAAESAG
jgi:hypothetical protein